MRAQSIGALLLSVILVAGCGSSAASNPAGPARGGEPATSAATTVEPSGQPVAETPADGPTLIDVPSEVVASTALSDAGGALSAGGVTVAVPAGALATQTTLVVKRLTAPFHQSAYAHSDPADAGATAIGHSYDFGPDGVAFGKPVDVTLPYDPAYVPAGTDAARIGVAYFTGTHWAIVGGTVDSGNHTVTVRLQAFHGELLTSILVATAVGLIANRAIKWYYGGEGVSSDPINDKQAAKWITPNDPSVQAAASTATLGGVPLGNPKKLAAYLEGNGSSAKPVSLVGPDGKPTTLQGRWTKAPGSNWQKPGDYLTKGNLAGDCTDVTSALVSVFRNLGYPAKAVFGYAVDKESPHVWGEVLIGGKPYLIDEEGQLQPLDYGVKTLMLIRPDQNDPRAFMWDENGQRAYDPFWWTKGYDVNGTWTGTFTITELSYDEQAAKNAQDAGCSVAILDALKGKQLPLTLTFTVDATGKGSAKMLIDTSSIKDANGKSLTSEPQTLPVTYSDNRITFQMSDTSGTTSAMSGQVVADAGAVVMQGTTSVSGPGFSASGVWTASPK
jgi:hypothetical protein